MDSPGVKITPSREPGQVLGRLPRIWLEKRRELRDAHVLLLSNRIVDGISLFRVKKI